MKDIHANTNLIFVPVGCVFSGILSRKFGRKRTMQFANVPLSLCWILFRFAKAPWQIYCGLGLTGFLLGCVESSQVHYTCEISTPKWRGVFAASSTLFFMLGMLLELLLGLCFSWRDVALYNFVVPVAAFNLCILLPESPHHLLERGKLPQAGKALSWLRGWVSREQVEVEFQAALRDVKASEKRSLFAPFSLVAFLFFVQSFGGLSNVDCHQGELFSGFDSSLNGEFLRIFTLVLELLGCLLCVSLVHLLGKRLLTLLMTSIATLCLALIAIHGTLQLESTWIPLALMLLFLVFSHASLRILPWILIGEVFCSERKCLAAGLCAAIGYSLALLSNKLFDLLQNFMTIPQIFWFYAAITALGSVVLAFAMPETEGLTLPETRKLFGKPENKKLGSLEDLFQVTLERVNLARDENSYKKFTDFDSSI